MERKRIARALIGLAVACLTVAGFAPPTSAAPEFELRGTVVDEHGAPLSSICVTTEDGATPTGSALTDPDGNYAVPLDAGAHVVRFTDCRTFPTHVTQWWKGHSTKEGADAVTVTDHDVELGTTALQPGVVVSGTVLAPGGAAGQADSNVSVSSLDGHTSSSAVTGPDGTYRTGPLPDGAYTVRFDGPAGSGQPVQYWKSAWTRSAAAEMTLSASAGTELTDVNASMVDGGTIEGVVTDDTGSPLANMCVGAYQRMNGSAGDGIGSATTAPDGSYALSNLPPVETLVQFSDCNNSGYVSEWYVDAAQSVDARITYVEPGTHLYGVDARMARAASITGQVTDSAGTPLEQICVNAVGTDSDGDKPINGTTTDLDGEYHLGGLGTEPFTVVFEDCNDVGPYLRQWYDGVADAADATTISLAGGEERGGVDARLGRAGTVSGRVTDRSGALEEICVQASDDRGVAASTSTDGRGDYRLRFDRSGSFAIQFVDCSDHPDHVGRWWGGDASRASAVAVQVELGKDTRDVSAELAEGAAGTVVGRVTNVRDEPMSGLCVVVYLAHGEVRVSATDADGNYTVPDVGSGTWAVAVLSCGDDDLGLEIPDPAVPAVAYRAQWLGGQPLFLPDSDGGPDPIAQGAVLVEVPSGGTIAADSCLGCGLVSAEIESRAGDVATFSFAAPDLLDGADVRPTATSAPIDYEVACAAQGRATLHSATVDSADSPVGVVGLAAGVDYDCVVTASVQGVVVADSAALAVAGPAATPTPPDGSGPEAVPAAGSDGRAPSGLAFTGASLLPMLIVSLALLVGGLVAAGAATFRLTRTARSSRQR